MLSQKMPYKISLPRETEIQKKMKEADYAPLLDRFVIAVQEKIERSGKNWTYIDWIKGTMPQTNIVRTKDLECSITVKLSNGDTGKHLGSVSVFGFKKECRLYPKEGNDDIPKVPYGELSKSQGKHQEINNGDVEIIIDLLEKELVEKENLRIQRIRDGWDGNKLTMPQIRYLEGLKEKIKTKPKNPSPLTHGELDEIRTYLSAYRTSRKHDSPNLGKIIRRVSSLCDAMSDVERKADK